MNVYADGCQSRSNTLSKSVADVVMPVDAVQIAFHVLSAPVPDAQTGSGSQGDSVKGFQLDAESEFLGAGLEPDSFYWGIATLWQMLDSGI